MSISFVLLTIGDIEFRYNFALAPSVAEDLNGCGQYFITLDTFVLLVCSGLFHLQIIVNLSK